MITKSPTLKPLNSPSTSCTRLSLKSKFNNSPATNLDEFVTNRQRCLILGANKLKEHQSSNIIYCGFVDDIDLYFKGCDLFLNPLQDGGGIKTKLVEALGFGKKCVSSVNGAIGVDEACCGGRLKIVADKDWNAYAMSLIEMSSKTIQNNHQAFYETYSWPSIAEKAMRSLV